VNDRIDVGLAAGADGFQLGMRSLPLAAARQLVGEGYLLGASVHTPEEALTAWTSGADFLLAGTIFASHTHPDEPPGGTDLLHAIIAKLSISPKVGVCPLVAIGGVTSANARQVMEARADGIAVISAILDTANTKEAVRELRIAINSEESRETL
jgi:thiamine-phosphate pyrophosphorylase